MTFSWWLFALYLAKGGDFVTTEYALNFGFRETNPLMQEFSARLAATVAVPALVELGARELERMNHPRMAKVARVAVIALWGYATAHNLRNGFRRRE